MRGVALLPSGEVLLQDQLSGLKPGSRVRWGMITVADADTQRGITEQEAQDHAAIISSSLAFFARRRVPFRGLVGADFVIYHHGSSLL